MPDGPVRGEKESGIVKRFISFFILALISAATLTGCATELTPTLTVEPERRPQGETVINQKISAEEAKKMMDAGGVTVVDVRSAAEYAMGHVPGAALVPLDTLAAQAKTALPDLDATLLVYCRSGNRSGAAAKMLKDLGYTKVYDFGGIMDWPYEVETGE